MSGLNGREDLNNISKQQTELQEDSKKNPILVEAVNSRTQAEHQHHQHLSYHHSSLDYVADVVRRVMHHETDVRRSMQYVTVRCNKIGHFSARCRTRGAAMNEIDDLAKAVDSVYLDTVNTNQQRSWYCIIQMGNQSVCWCRSHCNYRRSVPNFPAYTTAKANQSPSWTNLSLQAMGQFTTTLVHGQRSTEQIVFVVRGLKNNLLKKMDTAEIGKNIASF